MSINEKVTVNRMKISLFFVASHLEFPTISNVNVTFAKRFVQVQDTHHCYQLYGAIQIRPKPT